MSDILPFRPRPTIPVPQPDVDHITSPAVCLGCKHEWVAVAPAATEVNSLEYPSCGAGKGLLKSFVMHSHSPIYTCTICMGFLWTIVHFDGIATCVCANCGKKNALIEAFDQAKESR